VRGASAEHAAFGLERIVAGVDDQDVASRPVQPGDEDVLLAGTYVAQGFGDGRIEHDRRVG
jgi:hypothetical protein